MKELPPKQEHNEEIRQARVFVARVLEYKDVAQLLRTKPDKVRRDIISRLIHLAKAVEHTEQDDDWHALETSKVGVRYEGNAQARAMSFKFFDLYRYAIMLGYIREREIESLVKIGAKNDLEDIYPDPTKKK